MLRRLALSTLVAALALGTTALPATGQNDDVPGSVACPDGASPAGFDDVAEANVHAASIDCAVELGVLRGVTATSFAPAEAVTRGQLASLVTAALGHHHLPLPSLVGAPTFGDEGATHGDNIRRLAAAGVVSGRADGSFDPHAPVTRAQAATVLVETLTFLRGEDVAADDEVGFDDVDPDGVHAANIAAAASEGLLVGRGDGTFAPDAPTRRDQIATVVVRLLDVAPEAVVGEVWSLDQGTDLIHVYRADTEQEIATIDLTPQALQDAGFEDAPTGDNTVPHMIEFDSRERFAFVAATAGASTIVIDARTKEVVEVLPTGGGSHMAAVTPDDSAVWTAAIGAEAMVEIALDLDADEPTFEIARTLGVGELLAPIEETTGVEFPSHSPVCHQYSPDSSEAWITLGPAWDAGGFFVLDLASGEATHAWDPEEVRANCGVWVSDEQVIANWSGRVVEDDNTEGQWYVFDRETKELLHTDGSRGFDAHGVRLTPDGSVYWMVNRISDNAIVIDADTLEVVREVEFVGDTPDIIDFSPDGSLLYATLRGPAPVSGAPHAATGSQPGVAVVDTGTGELLSVIEPPEQVVDGDVINDVHGIGVRVRGKGE